MNRHDQQDDWLMAQVVQGKQDCLEPLVRRHANSLLTFIQSTIRDRHRSEEIFQDVFLAVWRSRRQYQPWRPFRPWLYAIATNKVRAELRARRRLLPVLSLDSSENAVASTANPSPHDAAATAEMASRIARAVERLPAGQRVVLHLRVFVGLSYSEIAQVLGRRETTVRSNMHHALAALRARLEPPL